MTYSRRQDVDEVALNLVIREHVATRLNIAERRIAIPALTAQGLLKPQIAALIGCSTRTVVRHRAGRYNEDGVLRAYLDAAS